MDKKTTIKTKCRVGQSLEEILVRRKIDQSLLPPLKSNLNSNSQNSFLNLNNNNNNNNNTNNITFNNTYNNNNNNNNNNNINDEDNNNNITTTKKDKVILMLTDYCKHLETQLKKNEKNSQFELLNEEIPIEKTFRGNIIGVPPYTTNMLTRDNNNNNNNNIKNDINNLSRLLISRSNGSLTANSNNNNNNNNFFNNTLNNENSIISFNSQSLHNNNNNNNRNHHNHHKQHNTDKKHEMHTVIQSTLSHIDKKVINLRQIFKDGNPLEERKNSCTKICAIVRGWLVRIRLQGFRIGLKEWKISRTRRVIWLLGILCGNYVYTSAGVDQMIMNRSNILCTNVFSKWLSVSRSTAPLRRKIRAAAEQMYLTRIYKMKKKLLMALKSVTIGKDSRVHRNKERKEFIAQIRLETSEKLKNQGLVGVVSESDLRMQVNRQILRIFLEKKMILIKKGIFSIFKYISYEANKKLKLALQFRYRQKAGKCFYAWTEWNFLVGQGLDRKRWTGPRKYEIRYNQKLVDHFARLRRENYCFYPWKKYFFKMLAAKRMNHRLTARFVSLNFQGWKMAARKLRRLRQESISSWKCYHILMCEKPFKAWRKYTIATKNFAAEQSRIVNAYIRWKGRQFLSLIIRTWRHQALYGRIDGMYTRRMLINSLSEQKMLSTSLEKMLSTQTLEMESCRLLLESEINKRKLLEEQVISLENDITKHRMIEHHLEQETIRLENIIEATAMINPRQVEHLRNMQIDFKFKPRKVVLTVPPEDFESQSLVEEMDSQPSRPSTALPTLPKRPNTGEQKLLTSTTNIPIPTNTIKKTISNITTNNIQNIEHIPLEKNNSILISNTNLNNNNNNNNNENQNEINNNNKIINNVSRVNTAMTTNSNNSNNERKELGLDQTQINNLPQTPYLNPLPPVPIVQPLPKEDRLLLDRVKWFIQRFKIITADLKPKKDFYPILKNKKNYDYEKDKENEIYVSNVTGDFKLKYDKITTLRKQMEEERKKMEEEKKTEKEIEALREKTNIAISLIEKEIVRGPLESLEDFLLRKKNIEDEAAAAEALANSIANNNRPSSKKILTINTVSNNNINRPISGKQSRPISSSNINNNDRPLSSKGLKIQNSNNNFNTNTNTVICDDDGVIYQGIDHILIGARPDGAFPDDIAKVLLAMMTFLETGDTGGLAVRDRKSWIKYVFTNVEDEKAIHQAILAREQENKRIDFMNTLVSRETEGIATHHEIEMLHHEEQHMLHHHDKKHLALETQSWRNALLYLRAVYPTTSSLAPENGLYLRISDMRDFASHIMESNAIKHVKKLRENRAKRIEEEKQIKKARYRHQRLLELREIHRGLGYTDEELLQEIDESENEDDIEHDSDSDEESVDIPDEYLNHENEQESLNMYSANLSKVLSTDNSLSLHDQMMNNKKEIVLEKLTINSMKEPTSVGHYTTGTTTLNEIMK